MNDVAVEVLTLLDYMDNDLTRKIPKKFIEYLYILAATSNYNVVLDDSKKLIEQNISEESKNLLLYEIQANIINFSIFLYEYKNDS